MSHGMYRLNLLYKNPSFVWYLWFSPGRRWNGFFYFMAWKTLENNRFFGKQNPSHSGKKRPFLPLRKRPKSTHLLPYRYSAALYLKQEGARPFISEQRPKDAPYMGAHASIQTVAARWYPGVSSAASGLSLPGCAAAGVHVYGKQRTFSVLRICTNNSGFLASCGPAAEKISGDVNPAHFFGSLFSPVRIMFDL